MDLTPATSIEEDLSQVTPQARMYLAEKARRLIEGLEPYVDGSLGPVSAQLANTYLKALRELGSLYHVYKPVPAKEPEPEDPKELERVSTAAKIAKVLGDVAEIEAKVAKAS